MIQIIWLALQDCFDKAVKNVKPSKFIFCNSLQTNIVRHVAFNTFAWSFLVSNTESESEMFSEIRPNRGSQKYASYFTWQVENKLFKASVFMNEQQPNSPGNEDRSEWQRRKTRLQWLMWLSTQRIGKIIEALVFPLEG